MHHKCWIVLLLAKGATSTTKQVILTFEYINGTLVPVVQNVTSSSSSNSGPLIASVFLILLSLLSLIGSLLIIGTIGSSIALRRLPVNILFLNLGVSCIVEIINLLTSAAYLLNQPWMFGLYPCYVNSFFMEFVPIIYTALLLTIIIDRTIALKDPIKYRKSLNICGQRIYLIICWILCFSVPTILLAGIIKSWPFPDKYSCQIMDPNSMYYGYAVLGVCFVVPWIAILVCLIFSRSYVVAEKKKLNKENRGLNQSGKVWADPGVFNMAPNMHMANELKVMGLVAALLLLYIVFLLPFVIREKEDQIHQGYNYAYYNNLTVAHFATNSSASSSSSGGVTTVDPAATSTQGYTMRDPNFVPEVAEDNIGTVDTVFVWLRFIHAVLVPLVIFVLHKDLRKKAATLIMCWRPNSVESKRAHHHISPFVQNHETPLVDYSFKRQMELEKKQKKFKNVTNYSVPVLFASSDGLYLRMVDNNTRNKSDQSQDDLNESIKAQWTVDPKFIMIPCDVYLPGSAAAPNRRIRKPVDDGFGATLVFEKKKNPPFKLKNAEEDEGFVDLSSNSNENTPLIPTTNESADKKKRSTRKHSKHRPEKKVTFQREVSEIVLPTKDQDVLKEEVKRRHQQLSPLPLKDQKRRKTMSASESPSKKHRHSEVQRRHSTSNSSSQERKQHRSKESTSKSSKRET